MIHWKSSRLISVLLACLLWAGASQAETAVRQILLIQNSGWMLPFYEDPENRFRASVTDFANRILPFSTELVVASFNQTAGDNKSPKLVYKGREAVQLAQAIGAIQLARKPGGAYADTDFREALVTAITEHTPGQPALIWVVTNNRNSPNNSAETVEKNKEFYAFLQQTPEIARIVGYPQKLQVISQSRRDYTANGLMFYGIAYGAEANAVLRQMLDSKRIFGQAGVARLKPLDAEALTFIPVSVDTPGAKVRLSEQDRKTLIITISAGSQSRSARLTGTLRNDFYPYDITGATLGVETVGFQREGRANLGVKLTNTESLSIRTRSESSVLGFDLQIPPLPSIFSPEVVFGRGYRIEGALKFQLRDQQLAVSPQFISSMNELFPRDPLPDLFVPGQSSRGSVTEQPLVILVEYPTWPLVALVAMVLLALGGAAGGFLLLGRTTKYRVTVDGHERTYALKPFSRTELGNARGERVGTIQRGLGRATAVKDEKFKSLSIHIQ
jgi:hypothetical protein